MTFRLFGMWISFGSAYFPPDPRYYTIWIIICITSHYTSTCIRERDCAQKEIQRQMQVNLSFFEIYFRYRYHNALMAPLRIHLILGATATEPNTKTGFLSLRVRPWMALMKRHVSEIGVRVAYKCDPLHTAAFKSRNVVLCENRFSWIHRQVQLMRAGCISICSLLRFKRDARNGSRAFA